MRPRDDGMEITALMLGGLDTITNTAKELMNEASVEIEDMSWYTDDVTDHSEETQKGIEEELDKLRSFDVFEPVDIADYQGHKVVSTRWVFGFRKDDSRSDASFKYFAPTTAESAARILDAIAGRHGLYQFIKDATNAFFHCEVEDCFPNALPNAIHMDDFWGVSRSKASIKDFCEEASKLIMLKTSGPFKIGGSFDHFKWSRRITDCGLLELFGLDGWCSGSPDTKSRVR
eukprot:984709-Amphidinium_carterae.3